MKEWKHWQQLYNGMVTEHTDDRSLHKREVRPFDVEDALNYVREKSDVGIYPAKSYMVAIIYAVKINEVYGDNIIQTLNDPDLLNGQDDFFVPFSEDPENYMAILNRLPYMGNWLEGGWAPKTVEYFIAECTPKGYEDLIADKTA